MRLVLNAEGVGKVALVDFLSQHFSSIRLLEEKQLADLKEKFARHI